MVGYHKFSRSPAFLHLGMTAASEECDTAKNKRPSKDTNRKIRKSLLIDICESLLSWENSVSVVKIFNSNY